MVDQSERHPSSKWATGEQGQSSRVQNCSGTLRLQHHIPCSLTESTLTDSWWWMSSSEHPSDITEPAVRYSIHTHAQKMKTKKNIAGCADSFQYLQNVPLIHFPLHPYFSLCTSDEGLSQNHHTMICNSKAEERLFFLSFFFFVRKKQPYLCRKHTMTLYVFSLFVEIWQDSSQIIANLICGTWYVPPMWQMLKEERVSTNTDSNYSNAWLPWQPSLMLLLRKCTYL